MIHRASDAQCCNLSGAEDEHQVGASRTTMLQERQYEQAHD